MCTRPTAVVKVLDAGPNTTGHAAAGRRSQATKEETAVRKGAGAARSQYLWGFEVAGCRLRPFEGTVTRGLGWFSDQGAIALNLTSRAVSPWVKC